MDAHPDFAEVDLPRSFDLPSFKLTPLSPEYVDEDFEAVTSSALVLQGLFGTWPEGLTLEENRIDLAWHEREFTLKRSFSWIVRSGAGAYLGCVYLFPELGTRGQAAIATWVRDVEDRAVLSDRLVSEMRDWFAGNIPEDIQLTWRAPTA